MGSFQRIICHPHALMETETPQKVLEPKHTSTDVEEAKKFGKFFINLLENHKENFVYYLADNALLDWFGRSVRGPRNIGCFFKNTVGLHKHLFNAAYPTSTIGYRESHKIKLPKPRRSPRITTTNANEEYTPPNVTPPPPVTEMGQGDGMQNNYKLESPMKRCKLDNGEGDSVVTEPQLKYLTTDGHIEFRKKSSKKLQPETKWNRPCKLEIAYCGSTFEECTIYMLIYKGNTKCRRNLLKDFDACDPDN